MAMHKLLVDDFYEHNYTLFAVHCFLEDYRLAYLLNQTLNISLKRCEYDLDFKNNKATYSVFEWEDALQQSTWNLLANTCKQEEKDNDSNNTLFQFNNTITTTHYLISEYKQVNYFIKLASENTLDEQMLLKKIKTIPQIITSFLVNPKQLKSKNNLIF